MTFDKNCVFIGRTFYSCLNTIVFNRKTDECGDCAIDFTCIVGVIRPFGFTGFTNPLNFVVGFATIFDGADRVRLL